MPDYDILIAGGGPVGASLALALHDSGLKLGVLETRPPGATPEDPRPLALSHGTRLILERLGMWARLEPVTPIARIHVSQRGGFGRALLDAAEARLPALGYVLDYTHLAAVAAEALRGAGCERLTAAMTAARSEPGAAIVEYGAGPDAGQCSAGLLVIADGGTAASSEEMRTVDYGQSAVTARVTATAAHNHVAYERFTPDGPLALLPFGEKLALVWTTTPGRAQQLCAEPEEAFLRQLQNAFGERLGRFTAAEKRASFPLALRTARRPAAGRVVRIGNAAQTLHPVAGQGLNIGLRDAWELAAEIRRWPRENVGAPGLLAAYAARRRLDRGGGIWFTHNLVRLFAGDLAPVRIARGLGLAALGAIPPARDFLVRRMTFGARG